MLNFLGYLLDILLPLTAIFLILLVLVQRGKGGGLAGAFGGMGGQSAFGTKAGDLFTRITIGVATFWIILCTLAVVVFNKQNSLFSDEATAKPPAANTGITPGTTDKPGATPEGAKTGDKPSTEKTSSEKPSGEKAGDKPAD